jgi:hypothetical protein
MKRRATLPSRRTLLALVIALGLAAAAVVATIQVTTPHGPVLDFGGEGSSATAVLAVEAQTYQSAYFGSACLSKPGQVTIRSIEPVEPRGGLTVTDFSVVGVKNDGKAILGTSDRRLRLEPSYRGGTTVTAPCATDDYVDVFVEVYKPGTEDAAAQDFIATYDSDGDRRTVPLHFGFSLCELDECEAS